MPVSRANAGASSGESSHDSLIPREDQSCAVMVKTVLIDGA